MQKKCLSDLTIKNNFMFGAVMINPENCRGLLERVLDMELLLAGQSYEELPDTYVIFICDFDPFGEKKYRYTFQAECKESETAKLKDGRTLVFLSTCGENEKEVSRELAAFLKFVKADLKQSQEDFHDPYVRQLQNFIRDIKGNREMEERFMILEEMLRDERNEGIKEGIKEGMEKGIIKMVTAMRKKGLSEEKIMELCDISEEEMNKYKETEN